MQVLAGPPARYRAPRRDAPSARARRTASAVREEGRWRTIEAEEVMDQQRDKEAREDASFARSNKTSMPYNPINLTYNEG